MVELRQYLRGISSSCPRRHWLAMGIPLGLGLVGRGDAAEGANFALPGRRGWNRAKSVVVIFANGGQSQLDMWDPKPRAPVEVRGEFSAIATRVPGMAFGEHLPRLAAIADRFTILRSMSHEDLDHGSAAYLALTGFYHQRRSGNPPPSPNDLPTLGAVIRRVAHRNDLVAEAVHLNSPALVPREPAPGQFSGILGPANEPLSFDDVRDDRETEGEPSEPTVAGSLVAGLANREQLPNPRLRDRLSLKQQLDTLSTLRGDRRAAELKQRYLEAHEILASTRAREAFQLSLEPRSLREQYGHHRSGQALLLARRLIEAGLPFIQVVWNQSNRGQDHEPHWTDAYGWDTHNDIFDALRNRLLPRFDQGLATFLLDLEQRGLLDQTLVICMGEFGRAPRVALERSFAGTSPGRKHWPTVYSILLAGAGVAPGAVVGASDRIGAEPTTERYGPWDVSATILNALGINPRAHYLDPLGRPLPVSQGQPIEAIYTG
ncbi:MAG: DUF1501 domain-containing protein [Planctomycetes bacterium]|nr:DUF1501 domain-containing protein [Planctomycetota bacterium]